jgi:hypothetical protein
LKQSEIIALEPGDFLYKSNQSDGRIYIVLFGELQLTASSHVLGYTTIGWTLGEELLYEKDSKRKESAKAV